MLPGTEGVSCDGFYDLPSVFRIIAALRCIYFNGIIRRFHVAVAVHADGIVCAGIVPNSIDDLPLCLRDTGEVIGEIILRRSAVPERIVVIVVSGAGSSWIDTGIGGNISADYRIGHFHGFRRIRRSCGRNKQRCRNSGSSCASNDFFHTHKSFLKRIYL